MSIYYCAVQFIFLIFFIPFSVFAVGERARTRLRWIGYTVHSDVLNALSAHTHGTIVRWAGSVSASHISTGHFSFSISFHKFCALHFVSGRRSTNAFFLNERSSHFRHYSGGTNDNGNDGGSRRKMWIAGQRRCTPNTTNGSAERKSERKKRTHITNLPEDRIIK